MAGVLFCVVSLVVITFIWAMVCCMISANEAYENGRLTKTTKSDMDEPSTGSEASIKMLRELNRKVRRHQKKR